MRKDDFYEKLHKKNLKAFVELGQRIAKGLLKIIDIRIDEEQFGHKRIIIFLHEEE